MARSIIALADFKTIKCKAFGTSAIVSVNLIRGKILNGMGYCIETRFILNYAAVKFVT